MSVAWPPDARPLSRSEAWEDPRVNKDKDQTRCRLCHKSRSEEMQEGLAVSMKPLALPASFLSDMKNDAPRRYTIRWCHLENGICFKEPERNLMYFHEA